MNELKAHFTTVAGDSALVGDVVDLSFQSSPPLTIQVLGHQMHLVWYAIRGYRARHNGALGRSVQRIGKGTGWVRRVVICAGTHMGRQLGQQVALSPIATAKGVWPYLYLHESQQKSCGIPNSIRDPISNCVRTTRLTSNASLNCTQLTRNGTTSETCEIHDASVAQASQGYHSVIRVTLVSLGLP